MRERLAQVEPQQQLAKRGRIIERHFGQIKQHEGFRRWTVGGADNVRTQWALLNLINNLRVLYTHWSSRKQSSQPARSRGVQCAPICRSRAALPSLVLFPARFAQRRFNQCFKQNLLRRSQDSRSPRRFALNRAQPHSARFWTAPVLRRFRYEFPCFENARLL